MSVTFAPATTGTGTWEVRCYCAEFAPKVQAEFGSYSDASMWLSLYKAAPYALAGCTDEDCAIYGPHLSEVQVQQGAPSVNMSNSNAVSVMEALGLITSDSGEDFDLCGSLPAEDFEGRILMALAVAPVSAVRPTYTEGGAEGEGALMVHCGRPEGYVQDRLNALREVVMFAREHDLSIDWA